MFELVMNNYNDVTAEVSGSAITSPW